MHRGYVKIWRKMLDNPRMQNPEFLALWVHLIFLATHKPIDKVFNGKRVTLRPGQFITGRRFLVEKTGISESKVRRWLEILENDQQIVQQKTSLNRLITIVNWDKYNQNDQQNDQRMSNECPTNDQRMTTNKNDKNYKNVKTQHLLGVSPKKQAPAPERELLTKFGEMFKYHMGTKYFASFKKDLTLLKRIVDCYGREKTEELMEQFFSSDDEFLGRTGYSVGVFHTQINKLNSKGGDHEIPESLRKYL